MATYLVPADNALPAVAFEKPNDAGLTADPDSLLAVFDSIEQSIVESTRLEEMFMSPLESITGQHPPCH